MPDDLLPLVWFFLLGVLLIGYAILDGFDLGVGVLHLFVARDDAERRVVLNSIGPLWDGNEVWLVTFGGALFAAFPTAYAATLSGFYTAFFLVMFALILRAVSIEFRSKREHPRWRAGWDLAFALGSGGAAFLFGVLVGNAMQGVPLDDAGQVAGRLSEQLGLYPLLVGAMTVALFALHAAAFLLLRTAGALHERVRRLAPWLFGGFLLLFLVVTALTLARTPQATANLSRWPVLWGVPALMLLAVLNVPRALHHGRHGYAFFTTSCLIAALVVLFGVAHYPRLLTARDPRYDLTVWNSASSAGTLRLMLWIAAIGMPLVLSYTALVYWTFRGRVELDEHSY
ncbi:MAG: cytochrome d ubiquinol oxidase subunit II [Planctomycetota bacterium]